jgi:hypothetical protein
MDVTQPYGRILQSANPWFGTFVAIIGTVPDLVKIFTFVNILKYGLLQAIVLAS